MEEKYSPPEQFSRYVVIPSPVYFNAQIKPRAKLLYGLLSCMSNAKGYAYPKDSTLQRYLGGDGEPASLDTVKRLLDQLEKAGAIVVENGDGRSQKPRKIYMADLDGSAFRKNAESIPQKCGMPIIKNKNNKKEIKEKAAADENAIRDYVGRLVADLELPEVEAVALVSDILGYAENRRKKKKPFQTLHAVDLQFKRLLAYSDGKDQPAARMRWMCQEAVAHNWDKIYPIKPEQEDDFYRFLAAEYGIEPPRADTAPADYF